MSADTEATWQLVELGDESKLLTTLSITYITDSLTISFDLCKLAATAVAEYDLENDVTLHADPVRAFITLHLYKEGDLTEAHFAAAAAISSAISHKYE